MGDDLRDALREEIERQNQAHEDELFKAWTERLDAVPSEDFKADVELQPLHWMSAGFDLLQSPKVLSYVQHISGKGAPLSAVLVYPAFQMGAEMFLKGMWLCQRADCRALAQKDYVNEATRKNYARQLKDLGHDLLHITKEVRKIPEYRNDPATERFLKRVEGVIRDHYFPLYEADKDVNQWAASRYPVRFYDDVNQRAHADAYKSYPEHKLIERLFKPMLSHVDKLWGLSSGLAAKRAKKKVSS